MKQFSWSHFAQEMSDGGCVEARFKSCSRLENREENREDDFWKVDVRQDNLLDDFLKMDSGQDDFSKIFRRFFDDFSNIFR